jgi:hypothetical protein
MYFAMQALMVEIKILYFGRVFPINGEGSAFLIETTAIHSDSQRNQAAATASLPLRATWKRNQGGCHDDDFGAPLPARRTLDFACLGVVRFAAFLRAGLALALPRFELFLRVVRFAGEAAGDEVRPRGERNDQRMERPHPGAARLSFTSAREWKAAKPGRKVIGYMPIYVPRAPFQPAVGASDTDLSQLEKGFEL